MFPLVSHGVHSLAEEHDVKKIITLKIMTAIQKMLVLETPTKIETDLFSVPSFTLILFKNNKIDTSEHQETEAKENLIVLFILYSRQ